LSAVSDFLNDGQTQVQRFNLSDFHLNRFLSLEIKPSGNYSPVFSVKLSAAELMQ
jgi:hypothetical protein